MGFLKSLLCGFLLFVSAQPLFCQDAAVREIEQHFNAYQKNILQEKIYVHTDKSTYLAGEIIWFKVYYVDAVQHRPLALSKVAYVDVLDGANKFVAQVTVALKDGGGSGSFFVPLTMGTGAYRLRAYTAWMKNFGPDQFFQKPIAIVNTLRNLETPAGDSAAKYAVQAFPEGGNLVTGLESTVAVKVTAPNGIGSSFSAALVTEAGDTVTTFRSTQHGIGRFSFTPSAAHMYTAVVALPSGRIIKTELPRAFEQGYVLQLRSGAAGSLSVAVSATKDKVNRMVYLVAHNRQKVQLAAAKALENGRALFAVDTALLAAGVTHFTLFDETRKPVCERLYFKKPGATALLQLTSDGQQYESRKKVVLAINTSGIAEQDSLLDLSLSVYKNDGLQDLNTASIVSYLWLTSELKGRVEAPDYYFSTDPHVAEATDNLMLTHGWSRFRWEAVLTDQKPAFSFAPEVNGHLVKAVVTNTLTGQPASGVNTYLSVPGSPFQFFAARSDSSGIALFDIKNQYGPGELIFQTNIAYDSLYRIEPLPLFAETFTTDPVPSLTFSKAHTEALLGQSIGMQVQNIYRKDSLEVFRPPNVYDTVPFYGQPDYSYALDVYTRFQTMEEVLREYVRPINVVQRRGGPHMLILDETRQQFFDDNELVLLDGIPLFNKNTIFSFDPLKVKRLDVITHKYFTGPNFFNGIASFTTYTGNYEGLQLDPRSIVVDYEGLQLEREFFAPVYQTAAQAESRVPDFRNTLLWQPHLELKGGKATVDFYTSDAKGSYVVLIEGLDAAGNPMLARLPIQVK